MELLNLYYKINLMKNTIFLFSLLFSLISCGVKVPYTNELRDQFSLDSDEKMRNVQFSISHTIILDQELESDSQNTTTNTGKPVLKPASADETSDFCGCGA